MSEKTYTVTITYEAQITTELSAEDIESGLWVGDVEVGDLPNGQIVTADAVDYEVNEE